MFDKPANAKHVEEAADPAVGAAEFGRSARVSWFCMFCVVAAWIGNALYALGEPGGFLKSYSPAIVASAMIGFVLSHGHHSGGWRSLLLFIGSVFLVGWAAETVGIITGFPFGEYHYSEIMWPFIGHVPVSVLPAYCVMGYVSWSMARILLNRLDARMDWRFMVTAPIVAALLMVIWDVSMDPLRATVEQRWIWLDGGLHYGIPLTNFAGWFGVTWAMFQLYALLLARFRPGRMAHAYQADRGFWYAVPLMYLAFAVEYLANPVVAGSIAGAVDVNGTQMGLAQLYAEIAVIACFTMLPAALFTASRVRFAMREAHRRHRRYGGSGR